MSEFLYYAGWEENVTVWEIAKDETAERYTLLLPVHLNGDGNNDELSIEVDVVTPAGYVLTERDFEYMSELFAP